MRRLQLAIALVGLVLMVAGCSSMSVDTTDIADATDQEESDSRDCLDCSIAVVELIPLPESKARELAPHKNVFSGEFYSNEEDMDYDDGYFRPLEYRQIIRENIIIAAALRNIKIDVCDSLIGVEKGSYDRIVIGSISEARVDSSAHVALTITVLDGATFSPLHTSTIQHEESKMLSDPLREPIHFVGEHKTDFQEQRTLFSRASYLCAQDLVAEAIKQGAAP